MHLCGFGFHVIGLFFFFFFFFFLLLQVLAAWDISFLMPSWAMTAEVARWGTAVSRIAPVGVCSEGLYFACRVLPVSYFFSNFWYLATLTKLNTEMRICRTKFGIVTLISVKYSVIYLLVRSTGLQCS